MDQQSIDLLALLVLVVAAITFFFFIQRKEEQLASQYYQWKEELMKDIELFSKEEQEKIKNINIHKLILPSKEEKAFMESCMKKLISSKQDQLNTPSE